MYICMYIHQRLSFLTQNIETQPLCCISSMCGIISFLKTSHTVPCKPVGYNLAHSTGRAPSVIKTMVLSLQGMLMAHFIYS